MSESNVLEEEEPILEEESILEEDEELIQEVCTLSGCFSGPSRFRGFGIQEDGATLAQDAERKLMDIVIGMPDPRVMETHELDEIEDHKLDPRPFHEDFAEFVEMQQDRMCAGAIDDGEVVGVGSFMSPDSVLRVFLGIGPKDIFNPIDTIEEVSLIENVADEPIKVVRDYVSDRAVRVRAVVE